MPSRYKTPHDAIVLDTFTQPEHAIGLLTALVPPAVAEHLDLPSATLANDHFVDEKLRELETDLLYRVATTTGAEAAVYVLVEHQSTADHWMPLRLLRYMLRIWDSWHREDPGAGLPPIVPIVLSHAPGGWNVARSFSELIEGPSELVEALRPHLPTFEAVVEDLVDRADDELLRMRNTALGRLVLLLLKHVRDGDIIERLPGWAGAFREASDASGPEALVRVLMYIVECVDDVPCDDFRWVEDIVGAGEGEVIMTLAERWREEGRSQGRAQGLEEGQRALVLRQMRHRFGAVGLDVESRLARATTAELELLADRILSADTLDDVLSVFD